MWHTGQAYQCSAQVADHSGLSQVARAAKCVRVGMADTHKQAHLRTSPRKTSIESAIPEEAWHKTCTRTRSNSSQTRQNQNHTETPQISTETIDRSGEPKLCCQQGVTSNLHIRVSHGQSADLECQTAELMVPRIKKHGFCSRTVCVLENAFKVGV